MTKYVCKHCGSDDIQVRQWVNPNTLKPFEWCEDANYKECWCENCKNISEWKMIEN